MKGFVLEIKTPKIRGKVKPGRTRSFAHKGEKRMKTRERIFRSAIQD